MAFKAGIIRALLVWLFLEGSKFFIIEVGP